MAVYMYSMVQDPGQGNAGTLPISSSGQPALLSHLISYLLKAAKGRYRIPCYYSMRNFLRRIQERVKK
ncbi:hypothetical protein LI177_13240 [bacterium 210820-DFI.6.37]|nr:hypothetical protein [bacterium 210820-DFI.6.37]